MEKKTKKEGVCHVQHLQKPRASVASANRFYEEWMEPEWGPVAPEPTETSTEKPKTEPRPKGKFRLFGEYLKDLSGVGAPKPRVSEAEELATFLRWVTNGREDDIHLAEALLFRK
ncbi:hypothetical protein QR680_009182 [Steinernema hermaphroditum]|uniref:Uncharacterized protein n=1 Tax=Steinernema hermaphroditum TaxID=289476 RepID=A0AA39M8E4_9BILA|nr:hypothetical protein QR680_009182 [Steinernema hermaphroditum]